MLLGSDITSQSDIQKKGEAARERAGNDLNAFHFHKGAECIWEPSASKCVCVWMCSKVVSVQYKVPELRFDGCRTQDWKEKKKRKKKSSHWRSGFHSGAHVNRHSNRIGARLQ